MLESQGKIRESDLMPYIAPFQFYVDAFFELGTCRSGGMGLTPIPFTSIVEYAKIFDVEEVEEFIYLIRLMDNVLLEAYDQKDKESKNGNRKKKTSG